MVLALEHGECMTSLVLDVVKMVFLFVFEWKSECFILAFSVEGLEVFG